MESIDQIPQMFVPQGIIPPIDELNPNLDPQNRNESNLTQTLGSIIDRRAPYDGNSEAKNALRNASIAGQDYAAKTNHVSRGFQVKIEKDQIGLTSGFVDAPCETKIAVMDGQNSNMNQLINQIEPQSRVNPNFSHPDSAKMPPHSNETLNNGLYNEEDIFNNEIEDNLDIISDTDEENVNEEANSFPNQMNGNFNSNKNLVKNPSHGSITAAACSGKASPDRSAKTFKKKTHRWEQWCVECNETFESKSDLHGHNKSKHGKNRHYCQECEFSTSHKSKFESHMKRRHPGVKEYSQTSTAHDDTGMKLISGALGNASTILAVHDNAENVVREDENSNLNVSETQKTMTKM